MGVNVMGAGVRLGGRVSPWELGMEVDYCAAGGETTPVFEITPFVCRKEAAWVLGI